MLYIAGCTLFLPASHMATYTMFLAAIFAIAIGLSFLETAANTYSLMIGAVFLAYVALVPNFSVGYVAVLTSVLFEPCRATIYAGTLNTLDNEHTEWWVQ